MYNTGIPMDALFFTVIWLISFAVAIAVGVIASTKKNKAVKVLKGMLIGLACWIGFSLILAFPINGMGAVAGTIGNIAMAYIFWNSPTKEEQIKILQDKLNKKHMPVEQPQPERKEQL